jgi:cysteinyl-tRNA synthetase
MTLPLVSVYNSLSQKKETLVPLKAGKIGIYVCGITVYDLCHIGHARSSLIFDMVVRYLRWVGYQVHYVRNITDIDDKIIKRANERGEDSAALSQRFIDIMHEDEIALGMVPPDEEPRATTSMPDIIQMIETLIEKGSAYVADNGDVCFEVRKFSEYGKLSKRNIDELRAGERVGVVESKRDPLDFVLWKLAKPDEPYWPSPWGDGRPGWHIECSAMSTRCLGNHFDIHGGGLDLKFPHHENEIAQSEAATGEVFANIWMHNGLLQINKEKMSKSLGNFLTIKDALAKHSAEVLRFFMLGTHYRQPLNYSEEMLAQAKRSHETLYLALRHHKEAPYSASQYTEKFMRAMNDDFNTPEAISVFFELASEIHRVKQEDAHQAMMFAGELWHLGRVLGLFHLSPEAFFQADVDVARIEALIQQRQQARSEKNWGESDRIRDELLKLGIIIEDTAEGASWRKL